MSYVKTGLKASRDALASKSYAQALESADKVLQYESENYNALVFRGLALLHLKRLEESESTYRKATQVKPDEQLAWQGLEKFYTEQEKFDEAADTIRHLMDLYVKAQDHVKCAETLQRLIDIRRKQNDARKLVEALSLLLTSSPLHELLSQLPAPDQANPKATTTFEVQMDIHVRALQVYSFIIDLLERLESDELSREVEKRRLRLDRAKKSREALQNEVGAEIWSRSKLPSLYEAVFAHPSATDDDRRRAEAKLLRYRYKLLLALPNPSSAASRQTEQGPRGTAATYLTTAELKQKEERQARELAAKAEARDRVGEMACGMVTISIADELAWKIRFDWQDCESLYDFPSVQLRKFLELFRFRPPSTADALVLATRALLLAIGDGLYLEEERQRQQERDIEDGSGAFGDPLALAIAAVESDSSSLFAHRVAATLYLTDGDYQSATEVAMAALGLVKRLEGDAALSLSNVKQGLNCIMATALTHLHPPQNHLRGLRYADSVLARNPADIEALLAKGYIKQVSKNLDQAKKLFEEVVRLTRSLQETAQDDAGQAPAPSALAHSKSPLLEARGEVAWCDVQSGRLEDAKQELKSLLDVIDPLNTPGVTAEQRAKTWWRYGQCLWRMGGSSQLDPANAFTCFITALKRSPAFAPAFTSLGIYYNTISPPDLDRSAKCFQKAFELDARESEAAHRLAKGFADEREWDLVEVVARRTIKGEGGEDALQGTKTPARLHFSKNTWAWRAIGSVELQNQKYEESIVAFQIALRNEPEDPSLWHLLGDAYARSGRHTAALRALEKAQRFSPAGEKGTWEIQFTIADVHRQIGEYDAAIFTFEQIIQNHTDQVAVRVSLAEAQLDSGRRQIEMGYTARARSSFVRTVQEALTALHEVPHLRSAWKSAADALFELSRMAQPDISDQLGTLKESFATLLKEQHVDQKVPAVPLGNLPSALEAREDAAQTCLLLATHLYKLIVVLNGSSESLAGAAWYDLSVALSALSRSPALPSTSKQEANVHALKMAIGCIKQALKVEPYNGRYWTVLGGLSFDKSIQLAQHAYIMAIECNPRSPIPWSDLGFLYLRHGDVELANEAFIRAQTLDPDWAQAWVGQGFVAASHQDERAARVLFEHAFRLSEGSLLEADKQFACAIFALFSSVNPPRSVNLHSPAFALSCYLSIRPMDTSVLHLASLFAERLGQHALAVERIETAASLLEAEYEASEDPEIAMKYAISQVNLGRIRLSQRRPLEALAAFEGAQALLEDPEQLEPSAEGERLSVQPFNIVCARVHALAGAAMAHYLRKDYEGATGGFDSALQLLTPDLLVTQPKLAQMKIHITCLLAQCTDAMGNSEVTTGQLMEL
ncbi:TPR-like protein [Tilletiaria anomala UBC 951]|uniref:TPR-like protein n=1 Tax=Tilletiaria anomala (strain ATCC 24038 / CBS 436.72 / UBC 951) TaxID=1037660 RepID=A0A066VQR1_TILAU|nr:TPR-like protein [Tilletiaria anomala UBC 951]KDN40890.1 TPR-like protein [Tilletiaria anomala UBC 951]